MKSRTMQKLDLEFLKLERAMDGVVEENKQLRAQVSELSALAFSMAQTSDRMKLDLILSGCLTKPSTNTSPQTIAIVPNPDGVSKGGSR